MEEQSDYKDKREQLEKLIDELSSYPDDDPSVLHDFILIGRRARFNSDGDRFTDTFTLVPISGLGIIEVLGYSTYLKIRTEQGLFFEDMLVVEDEDDDDE